MPKFLLSLMVLVLATSCAVQPVTHAPDFLYPGKVAKKRTRAMSPRLAERSNEKSKAMLKVAAPSLVIQPQPTFSTNILSVSWQYPDGYVSGSSVRSWNLYIGSDSGVYGPPISITNLNDTTNYSLAIVDQTVSTNPPVDLYQFPSGVTMTNVEKYYFAVSAVGLQEGPLSKEISWPPPPWNTLVLTWDTGRDIALQQSSDFKNWTTITNVIGTNVITLPISGTNYFYRGVTTNPPPVQLHINGTYIAP